MPEKRHKDLYFEYYSNFKIQLVILSFLSAENADLQSNMSLLVEKVQKQFIETSENF